MKRVVLFIGAVALLGGAGAYLVSQRSAVEPETVQAAADQVSDAVRGSLKGLLGLGGEEPGVVATVDGEPITVKQVEGLYDMRTPSLALNLDSLEKLRYHYSGLLLQLVVQRLVRNELTARALTVTDVEVRRLEDAVSSNFSTLAGDNFSQFIEEEGVNADMWREQLRARLEQERWVLELAKTVVVSPEDVQHYLGKHPELATMPELVDCLIVTGSDAKKVNAARTAGLSDVAHLRAQGLDVRRISEHIPEQWKSIIKGLSPGQTSSVRTTDNAGIKVWQYALLMERMAGHPRSAAEMYSHVEALLVEQRLPEAFDAWVARAVEQSDIRVAAALSPHNAPKPVSNPVRFSTMDRLKGGAAGEVSGEVTEDLGDMMDDLSGTTSEAPKAKSVEKNSGKRPHTNTSKNLDYDDGV